MPKGSVPFGPNGLALNGVIIDSIIAAGFDPSADPILIGLGVGSLTPPTSISIGRSSVCGGIEAVAVGYHAGASLKGTTVGADTSGYPEAVTIGHHAVSIGVGAIAVGSEVEAAFDYSIGIGYNAFVGSPGSIAIGHNVDVFHANAVSIGDSSHTTHDNTVMLGNSCDAEVSGNGHGYVMRSPDGQRWLLTVSDAGAVVVTSAP